MTRIKAYALRKEDITIHCIKYVGIIIVITGRVIELWAHLKRTKYSLARRLYQADGTVALVETDWCYSPPHNGFNISIVT